MSESHRRSCWPKAPAPPRIRSDPSRSTSSPSPRSWTARPPGDTTSFSSPHPAPSLSPSPRRVLCRCRFSHAAYVRRSASRPPTSAGDESLAGLLRNGCRGRSLTGTTALPISRSATARAWRAFGLPNAPAAMGDDVGGGFGALGGSLSGDFRIPLPRLTGPREVVLRSPASILIAPTNHARDANVTGIDCDRDGIDPALARAPCPTQGAYSLTHGRPPRAHCAVRHGAVSHSARAYDCRDDDHDRPLFRDLSRPGRIEAEFFPSGCSTSRPPTSASTARVHDAHPQSPRPKSPTGSPLSAPLNIATETDSGATYE